MLVLNQNTKRDTGRSAQLANIGAAQAVAGIVRSTLGPRAMLKMLLDPMGGIVWARAEHKTAFPCSRRAGRPGARRGRTVG